ncbi:hypothetical protein F5883DRAFT_643332 [Diaporthe sp. PMI_573]|nr:hypothetical protein F5883DRAFT_643332 [Diaporthaceae sp. PMI_573]
MQRFLPAGIEPLTFAAMRDYMVARLGQFQTFDKLLMRNASIEILKRDATDRLYNLRSHAQALLTDFSAGGPDREAFLPNYSFGPENFQEVLRQNAALGARRVVFDADFITLNTLNRSLEQNLEFHQDILQRVAEEREHARRIIQQRDNELEEERERTKRVVERVEAERDRANRTAKYLFPQLYDLKSRLQETESLYQASKRSVDFLTNTGCQQDYAAAARGITASPEIDARSVKTDTEPGTSNQDDHESKLEKVVESPKSESRFAELFAELAVKEGQNAGNSIYDEAASQRLSGDASVTKPVTPSKVINTLYFSTAS